MSCNDFGGSVVPGLRRHSLALTIHASRRRAWEEEEEFERASPRIEPRRHKGVFSSDGTFRVILPQMDLRRRASCFHFGGWRACRKGVKGQREDGELEPPELPFDVIRVILSYLDAEALCSCSQVSTYWRSLADADELWFDLVLTRFGVSSAQLIPPPARTKELFQKLLRCFHQIRRESMRQSLMRGLLR